MTGTLSLISKLREISKLYPELHYVIHSMLAEIANSSEDDIEDCANTALNELNVTAVYEIPKTGLKVLRTVIREYAKENTPYDDLTRTLCAQILYLPEMDGILVDDILRFLNQVSKELSKINRDSSCNIIGGIMNTICSIATKSKATHLHYLISDIQMRDYVSSGCEQITRDDAILILRKCAKDEKLKNPGFFEKVSEDARFFMAP